MGINIKENLTPPVLLIIFLLIVSLIIIFPVLNMIVLGAILAYGVRHVAVKIQSKVKYSSLSVILAMVAILIPLILLVAYIALELSGIISGFLASNSYGDINSSLTAVSSYLPWKFDINSISSSLISQLYMSL